MIFDYYSTWEVGAACGARHIVPPMGATPHPMWRAPKQTWNGPDRTLWADGDFSGQEPGTFGVRSPNEHSNDSRMTQWSFGLVRGRSGFV